MKKRILLSVLALCLCTSSTPVVHAGQAVALPQETAVVKETASELVVCDETASDTIPTPSEVYQAMVALKDQDAYKEGTTWTDDEPYSDTKGYYRWNGGTLDGKNIMAVGCVAFAFILSDAAFGSLPARMYAPGGFQYEDIKVGDILRMNTDTHTVIVLETSAEGVVVAEGNINTGENTGKVHWGRAISKDVVMRDTSHYITRYPEGYVAPDDPTANETIAEGTLDTGLAWNLTKAGTLTIFGSGAMPDFSSTGEQPWASKSSEIRTVIIEDGVTSIGACAFWNCGVLGAEISSSVTMIGNSAFRSSSIISVNIPSSVKTIGDSAFRECGNLRTVSFSEGLETIGQNAFRACTNLGYIDLPASIGEVGAAAFFECTAMTDVTFAPGNKTVKVGDNLFTRCYGLISVTLPASINRIGAEMFQNCMMLPGVEIPQGAESIGASAFASSGSSVIIIPDSVTSIGAAAFSDCPLKNIYFTGTEAQWNAISKSADVITAVSNVAMHYGPLPEPTTSPDPTTDPDETTSPDPTTDPEETTSPVPTTDPEVSASPNPTTAPDETTSPVPGATVSPKPSTAPEVTTSPNPSTEPGGITSPNPTTAPEVTTTPNPTTDPVASNVPDTTTPAPTAVPDNSVPFIKGESGKEGWKAIQEDAAKADEGNQINVNMNHATAVPGDVIDSIKGKNVTLTFDMGNGMVWSVNGRDVTADHANNVDFSVQVGTTAIPRELVESTAGNRQTIQLQLAHSGEFGYKATLVIHLGSDYAGKYADLFYYNESDGKLEFVAGSQISENGSTELTFSHASDYIIVVGENRNGDSNGTSSENGGSDNDSKVKEAESHSPKTGEMDITIGGSDAAGLQQEGNGLNLIWLLWIGAVGAAAAGLITFFLYRRENEKERP